MDTTGEMNNHYVHLFFVIACSFASFLPVTKELFFFQLPRAAVVQLEAIMYVLVGVSLSLLVVAFFILISYKALQSNWNSIHINLIFVIVVYELAFAVGINRTRPEVRLIHCGSDSV